MTEFPFHYSSGGNIWGIKGFGSRWEVDDFPNNSAKNTYHQIWVRANGSVGASLINGAGLTNMAIPKVLVPKADSGYEFVDSTLINAANVYLYGSNGAHKALEKFEVRPRLDQYPTSVDIIVNEINTEYTLSTYMNINEIELYDANDNMVAFTVSYYHPIVYSDIANLQGDLDHQYQSYRNQYVLWNNHHDLVGKKLLTLDASAPFVRIHVYWDRESRKAGLRIIGNNGSILVTENGTGGNTAHPFDPISGKYRSDWLVSNKGLTIARFIDFNPYITVSEVSNVANGALTVSGTVFSSIANIQNVKVAVFQSTVDLSDENAVKTFVNTNGSAVTDSMPQQHMLGRYTDISVNNAFAALSASATESLINGELYIVCVTSSDVNGNIGFLKYQLIDNSLRTVLPVDIYTRTGYTSYTPIDELTHTVEDIGYHQISCALLVNKTTSDGGVYMHNGWIDFEVSEDNGTTWTSFDFNKRGFTSTNSGTSNHQSENHGKTNQYTFHYETTVANTMFRPKIQLNYNGQSSWGNYWFGYFFKDHSHMSSIQLNDDVKMIEMYKNNAFTAPNNVLITWQSGAERINTSTDTFEIVSNNLQIKEPGVYLFVTNTTIKNNASNGHNYNGRIEYYKDDVLLEKGVRGGEMHQIGTHTNFNINSMFLDNVTQTSDFSVKTTNNGKLEANTMNIICMQLDPTKTTYAQCLMDADQTLPLNYDENYPTYISEWKLDTDTSVGKFSVSGKKDIIIQESNFYSVYMNMDISCSNTFQKFVIAHLYVNGVRNDSTRVDFNNVNFGNNKPDHITGQFHGVYLGANDKVSVGMYMYKNPADTAILEPVISTKSTLIFMSS